MPKRGKISTVNMYCNTGTTCNKTVSDITYLPGTSRLTKLSTSAVDLSCFSVWDSRTTRTEIYPGKTAERTGTGSEPEGTEK